MLHSVTLERLLTFPSNNYCGDMICNSVHSHSLSENQLLCKGAKRKLDQSICDERPTKHRFQETCSQMLTNPHFTNLKSTSSSKVANLQPRSLCLPLLSMSDPLRTEHWCYTKVSCEHYISFNIDWKLHLYT